jgi:hypothetical protein
MQVDPARLVELAATSERVLAGLCADWAAARDEVAPACADLGDATGMRELATAYDAALVDADEAVTALAEALGIGVAGLLAAAQDAIAADDTAAAALEATAFGLDVPTGSGRGRHGRHEGH